MIEVGKTYRYEGIVVSATFKEISSQENTYVDVFYMISKDDKTIKPVRNIVEPKYGSECKCVKIDDGVPFFQCVVDYVITSKYTIPEETITTVRDMFRRFGLPNISEFDIRTLLVDVLRLRNISAPIDEKTLLNKICDWYNSHIYYSNYNGSAQGALSYERECLFMFSLVLGFPYAGSLYELGQMCKVSKVEFSVSEDMISWRINDKSIMDFLSQYTDRPIYGIKCNMITTPYTEEDIKWCRANAPEALKEASDAVLWDVMCTACAEAHM